MKHQEYEAAIKRQQSFIRRLFRSRERRSEVIQELTEQRYSHLTGRFFRPTGDHFKCAASDCDYYIYGISTESNYVMSDTVYVNINCRYICRTYCDKTTDGISILYQSFRFLPSDDLDEILSPMWVTKEKAVKAIDDYYTEMKHSLLKTS